MEKTRYRTQLYLDEVQYRFLKESAAKYDTSIAAVVRDLIDREMGDAYSVSDDDPLFQIGRDAAGTGRTDGSEAHDRYIYTQQQQSAQRRDRATAEDRGGESP